MLRALRDSETRGRPAFEGRALNLPSSVLEAENRTSKGSFAHATQLNEAFQRYEIALKDVLNSGERYGEAADEEAAACEALLEQLLVVKNRIRGQSENELDETKEEAEFCLSFFASNAWEAPLQFLERVALPLLQQRMNDPHEQNVIDICTYCLVLLKDLCFSVPQLAEALGEREDLIITLFSSLTSIPLCEFIAMFCEGILSARRSSVFDLERIVNLDSLIASLNACQLVCFCRILSCVIIDPVERLASSEGRHLESFALLDQRRRLAIGETLGNDLVAKNHLSLLNNSQVLISRLIQLLGDLQSEEAEKRLWLGKSNVHWRSVEEPSAEISESVQPFVIGAPSQPRCEEMQLASSSMPNRRGWDIMRRMLRWISQVDLTKLGRYLKEKLQRLWMMFRRRNRLNHSSEDIAQAIQAEEEAVDDSEGEELPVQNEGDILSSDEDVTMEESEYVMSSTFWTHPLPRSLWQLTQRLDVACFLSTLCVGPCKRAIQDMLTNRGLVRVITERFDALPWDPSLIPANLPSSARVHGSGCECDPHGAFKSQLLRLVHNFCDREADNKTNKSHLFSKEELAALGWDYQLLHPDQTRPFGWDSIEVSFPAPLVRSSTASDGHWQRLREADALTRLQKLGLPGGRRPDHGLAWRIAAVLVSGNYPSADSALHFWIFAALEALLRASDKQLKMMVCAWGVLRAVVSAILKESPESGTKPPASEAEEDTACFLQTRFDLLGELIKDNPDALAWMCNSPCVVLGPVLGDTVIPHICSVAMNHLVDGNVFLRALSLTLRRNPENVDLAPARLWFSTNATRMSWGLWSVVDIFRVSQENLCCLNTAVVLLTFARWDHELESFIANVLKTDFASSALSPFLMQFDLSNTESPQIRFRKLLWFWRCYYSCRTSDRKSLEHSSAIKFEELELTVRMVCDNARPGGSVLTGDSVIHVPYFGNPIAVVSQTELDPWDCM